MRPCFMAFSYGASARLSVIETQPEEKRAAVSPITSAAILAQEDRLNGVVKVIVIKGKELV